MNNLEKFIEKARKVHGDKYDYSKVQYINSKTKVCIICPEHGEFWQEPANHVRGYSCPRCANIKRGDTFRSGTEDFIKKAREIHGDKYDYSKVNYINSSTKVCIICPKHGEFWMLPLNHIYCQKQGCPKCVGRGLTTEEVIEKFKEVHGDKYDYYKVIYNKMHEKVCIICPEHGEFYQTPSKHINGRGCPKCGKISMANKRRKTTEQFIEEARKIHGNKYDYSKVVYESALKKVCIICPEHGEFFIRPNDHLNRHGCPMCNQSHLEQEIKQFLIENNIQFEEQKRFDWLGKQSLDFYLPEYNTGIECQGEQHFKPIDMFGGKKEFKIICYRDEKKMKLCENNGVKLLHYFNKPVKNKNYNVICDKGELLKKISKV